MRTIKCKTIAILMTMLLSGIALAAEESGGGREADHAALRVLMAHATQALNTQDMDALAACFTKDFVFTTVDQSVLTSILSMKQYYDRMLRQKDSLVTGYKIAPTVEIPTVFLDANTGYSWGTSDDTYVLRINGRTVHMPCRWTATVVREDGVWKLAAVHTGVNVTDNTVLQVRTMPWWRRCLLACGIGKFPGER